MLRPLRGRLEIIESAYRGCRFRSTPGYSLASLQLAQRLEKERLVWMACVGCVSRTRLPEVFASCDLRLLSVNLAVHYRSAANLAGMSAALSRDAATAKPDPLLQGYLPGAVSDAPRRCGCGWAFLTNTSE